MPKITKIGLWLNSLSGSGVILEQMNSVKAIAYLKSRGETMLKIFWLIF